MKKATFLSLFIGVLCNGSYAANEIFCPQKAGYARVGMTQEQVIDACGRPQIRQASRNRVVTKKVSVQQLFYGVHGGATAFYGVWKLPGGNGNYGDLEPFGGSSSAGQMLEIDVVDDRVVAIKLNGGSLNSLTTCDSPINVGDSAADALSACGTPTKENETYVNMPIPSKNPPEIWIYQSSEYNPQIRMTIVDGRLVSIQ